MTFTSSAALLDAVVLAVVSREEQGTYGYRITQQIKEVLDLSESRFVPGPAPSAERPMPDSV